MYSKQEVLDKTLKYFNGDELAANVFMTKYALKNKQGTYEEATPDDLHNRLAYEFTRIESKFGGSNQLSFQQILSDIKDFKYIVPQGSPMFGIGNGFAVASLSNCVVVASPNDNVSSIVDSGKHLANLFKRRCGVGIDISNLRPEGMSVKNSAGTTTGAWSFADFYSYVCRMIGQNGRRGALMISIDIRHPDVDKFALMKHDLTKVTGANVSIRISDDFMEAVEQDQDFTLKFPVDSTNPIYTKTIRARDLWKTIVGSATKTAEPGLLMWGNIEKYLPAESYKDVGFKTLTTNPCIVGDTLIAVADGRNAVSIAQLQQEGVDVPVYCTNTESGITEIKMGRNPRVTGLKKEVWKLTLDDDSILIATPNHKILAKNLIYCELKDLKEGDSIYPFYSFDNNGYRQISNTGKKMKGGAIRNRRQYRLIHEHYNEIVDAKTYAIHHVDHNSHNDNIGNLLVMTHEQHRDLHSKNMIGDKNPYFRMSDKWKRKFASHPAESNPRYCGVTNEQIIQHGRSLFEQNGVLTKRMWQQYAKINNLPQHLSNNFRFGTFTNFKNQVSSNHKVKNVEFYGYEDVYNITVDDNHNYHVITSKEDEFAITSSGICVKNCGEIPLSAYDSCRLISVNLKSFVENPFTNEAKFNFDLFNKVTKRAMRLSDDLIELELEKLTKIIYAADTLDEKHLWQNLYNACYNGRRTGLGTHGLADALACMKMSYDSAEALVMIDNIYRTLKEAAYEQSVSLAKERGSFPVFDWELEKDNAFIKSLPIEIQNGIKTFGRRNISILTNAPTGSVSIMSQTSSGLEPVFRNFYIRRRKLSHNEQDQVAAFVDVMGDKWSEYKVYHHNVSQYLARFGTDTVPSFFTESDKIDWKKRVEIQSIIQKHIDHSISSTINLPKGTSPEVVSELYQLGWKLGLKGITVYVDGSRDGVLITETKKDTFPQHNSPKRPQQLECDIHNLTVKGEKWTILVGLLDNKPYEILGGANKLVDLPKSAKKGTIIKTSITKNKARYDLAVNDMSVKDVVQVFDNANYSAFTRLLSLSLRHGAPINYVVEQLQKDETSDMFSFARCIARVLKQYVPDGTKATGQKTCEECSSIELSYQDGCVSCTSCGWSKCS